MIRDERMEFLHRTELQRAARIDDAKRLHAVVLIQSVIRSFIARRRIYREQRRRFDELFARWKELDKSQSLPSAVGAFRTARWLLTHLQWSEDAERFAQYCRYLIVSCDSASVKTSCVALVLSKDYIGEWTRFLRSILIQCCQRLPLLQLNKGTDIKLTSLLLHVIVTFSTCNSWTLTNDKPAPLRDVLRQFCAKLVAHLVASGLYVQLSTLLRNAISRTKPALGTESLKAIFVILMRPLIDDNFSSQSLMRDYTLHVFTCPALTVQLSDESINLLKSNGLFEKIVSTIANDDRHVIIDQLNGNTCLFLLANLIHLGSFDQQILVENLLDWTQVLNALLDKCRNYTVSAKKNRANHWHPIFGWYTEKIDEGIQCTMPLVRRQLEHMWSRRSVECLFRDLIIVADQCATTTNTNLAPSSVMQSTANDVALSVRKLLKKMSATKTDSSSSSSMRRTRFGSPQCTLTALVCAVYQNAFNTFVQLQIDILSGLCRADFLLPKLWRFISTLGVDNGLKTYLELLAANPTATYPEFAILTLFCDGASCIISILDETEMYEKQTPFHIDELCAIARFCNLFCYRAVWDDILDRKSRTGIVLFNAVYHLNMVLYYRDSRRDFTKDPKFWLAKESSRSNMIISEFEKSNERAVMLLQRMPHLVAHKDRVILFRKYVRADKDHNGVNSDTSGAVNSTLISIHRSMIVEDGYRQLSQLSNRALKGVIRVKFINEQGLDEAGIDQDGVFKEFLEQTIQKVFDPALNLFKSTDDGRLYPSPTSSIHENHLALFDFVGRMLAKAIYEVHITVILPPTRSFQGIVVDVSFTSFFLASALGRRFSALDELSSLDSDLYKSLTYVKHYNATNDVADLELTYSVDENCIGEMVTVDLIPGGRTIQVTNDNKISYIHAMAKFRVVDQIREQTRAFVNGFQSIVNASWLALFSPQELQRLISGDSVDIDLNDLRKHTQYYGGFHSNHRVINWLWTILDHEFSVEERRLFLKFVTSCSRPPLLGFAHLEPAFSIRCVEVGDDQDQGDTLASVIRGFLAIKRKEPMARLPTASTCFNLLKLPNYGKKSTLCEKLRYAIHSQTGFELS